MTQIPVAGLFSELTLGTAKLQTGVNDAQRMLGGLEGRMVKTGGAAKRSGDQIDTALGRALKGAGASADVFAKRIDYLANRFNPLYAASRQYERELRLLDEAMKRGVISASLYDQNLNRLNSELAGGVTKVDKFGGGMRNMGGATSNAASQFQDMIVQWQSGTPILTVALQQGTQLTGMFTQMGLSIKTVGPVLLGAFQSLLTPLSLITIGAIAAGGALVKWFSASGEEVRKFSDVLGEAETALTNMRAAADVYSAEGIQGLIDKYGELNAAINLHIELQRQQTVDEAMASSVALLESLRSEFSSAFDLIDQQSRAGTIAMKQLTDQTGLTNQQVRDLKRIIEEFGAAKTFEERAAALAKLEPLLAQSKLRTTALYTEMLKVTDVIFQMNAEGSKIQGWLGLATRGARTFGAALWDAAKASAAVRDAAFAKKVGPDERGSQRGQEISAGAIRSAEAVAARVKSLSGSGGGGGGLSDLAKEVEKLNEAAAKGEGPLQRYQVALAKLDALKGKGLTDAAYSKEVERLNKELADSLPLVGDLADAFGAFVSRGFKDFKSFTKSILGSFQKLIADMISTAIKNRIIIGLGVSGGSVAGSAAGAATGGGGILSSLLGGGGGGTGILGSIAGAFSGGFSSVISGLFSGGLSGAAGAIGTALTGATSGLAGLATAAGALAPLLAAGALIFGFFKKKVTELNSGLRITTVGMGTLVETFRTLKTTKFFGLSKKVKTTYDPASDAIANPIEDAIANIQTGALDAAKVLGVSASAFNRFSHSFEVSLKGLSDTDAQRAIQDALNGVGDAFAGMVPDLKRFKQAGEGAYATLQRLAKSLVTVNDVFRDLGFRLFNVSVTGGGAAAAFADLLGGLDSFTQITASYYQNFYSDGERLANATKRLKEAFGDLGLSLPATRAGFRALVDAADAAGNRDLVASLLKLSPAFANISEGAEDSVSRINDALGKLNPEDFATALDYGRARAALAYGGGLVSSSPAFSGAATTASPTVQAERNDAIWTSINNRLSQIEKYFVRWDIDGLPPERAP